MEHNHVRQPFIFLWVTVTGLLLLSFIPTPYFLKKTIHPVDILADIKPGKKTVPPKETLPNGSKINKPLKSANDLLVKDFSNHKQFELFLRKLKTAKKEKVRIAYFGDSFIEADLLTHEFRQLLQKMYGGNGPGFIAMESINSESRKSIQQKNSGNWKVTENNAHLLNNFTSTGTIASYTLSKNYSFCNNIQLCYQSNQQVTVQVNQGTGAYPKILPASNAIQQIQINDAPVRELEVQFPETDTKWYGISFEDSTGIYVDNFSVRGSNGNHLAKIDSNILQQFNTIRNYNLIILHFGINVLDGKTNFDWYKTGMQKTITYLKKQLPDATILLLGCSDKSTRINGVYATDEGVPVLVALQEKLAAQNGLCFWNLFANMGGYNSILQWVNDNPAKAYKDYTHINANGAAQLATLLFQQFKIQ